MTANAVTDSQTAPIPPGRPASPGDLDRLLDDLAGSPAVNDHGAVPPDTAFDDDLLMALGDRAGRLAVTALNRAVAAAVALVAIADRSGGPRARARVRRAAAQSLAYAGRFPEALERCAEAIAIAGAADDAIEGARARLASIHALASLGRFDEALAAGETAHAVLLAAGEPALAARADLNLGTVLAMRDEPRRALTHFDRARPAVGDDPAVLATLETNRGNGLTALDDFVGAEAAYSAAVAAFDRQGQALAAAVAEGNLAFLVARQGRLPAALFHFERARRLLEQETAPAHLSRLQAEQAHALATLGLPGDALAIFERVLPDLDAQGLTVEAAQARFGLGAAYRRLGRLPDAAAVLAATAATFAALGQPAVRARVVLEQAELLAASGDTDGALALVDEASPALSDRPAKFTRAQSLRARLLLAVGNRPAADLALAAAFPSAQRLALAPVLAELHLTRGRFERTGGEPDRAKASFRAAIAEIERVRGTLQAERFRTAYFADRLAPYEELILTALDAGAEGIAEAFAVVERAKSRSLLDVLGGAVESSGDPHESAASRGARSDPAAAALLAETDRLRAELNWRYSRLAETGPGDRSAWEDWGTTVRTLEDELDAIQTRLAATQPPTGLHAPSVGLPEVQAALPSDTALLEYFVAGDELIAFLVRPDARQSVAVYRRLASVASVAEGIRRFRFQVSRAMARLGAGGNLDRLTGDAHRALAALAARLIAPILPELAGINRLIVVPHGPLHAVPFHALPVGGAYLVEQVEVAQVPSASVFARLAGRPRQAAIRRPAVVVGCADELTPEIPAEVARVAAAFGDAHVLLDPEATVDRVTAAAAAARVIHFACHGRFSPDRPASSGLKLADRWLTVREMAGLQLDGAHVTLSGCDTGRADVRGGDELVGLARTLLAAGAASVLVSLWPVHDGATVELMGDMYDRLQSDSSPIIGAALRHAQVAALGRRPHPAYWAPFVYGGTPWS